MILVLILANFIKYIESTGTTQMHDRIKSHSSHIEPIVGCQEEASCDK